MTPESATPTDLLERLASHRTLKGVPRVQLEWLLSRGRLQKFVQGETVIRTGEMIHDLWILLAGEIAIRVGQGSAARKIKEWYAGDVTGFLPFSRMSASPGMITATVDTDAFLLDTSHFPALIRDCPDLTGSLVHSMLDRVRFFQSSELQDEKILSLGRVAAGLAHELNNPASAVVRSAEALERRLPEALAAFRALGAATLPDDQLAKIERAADACVEGGNGSIRSPIAQLDREDSFSEWLADHGADTTAAHALSESALTLEALDDLAKTLDPQILDVTLGALAAGCATRTLAAEIERAAARIHQLVAAVKGFTYMDQATIPKPVDVGRGLSDTITVLHSKAKKKSVEITLALPSDLPPLMGLGGELNQVWSNIIDNALDAVPEGGHIRVTAAAEGSAVVVRIVDDGPGIPDGVRSRLFEPFFTTKPVGEGTGLGLDIARRLVGRHEGHIEVDSRPGRTEFRVILPLAAPAAS
jgi:signal transduction histidine kinase